MDQNILNSLRETLAKNNQISIAVGKNATIDEMGAALSLYLSLKYTGKNVSIASPKEPIVELSSLVGINKVKGQFEGETNGDLTVSFPYNEGEIEKVSYTLENGFLNIIVKAGEQGLSFSEKDIKYQRGSQSMASPLLFVIGTPNLSDLGKLFDPEALKETTVVNIDNKSQNQGFGDIVLVSPRYSSVSEIIADLLNSLELEIDKDIAQNLLLGITKATKNFSDNGTTSLAFEIAALLMKKGAVRPRETRETVEEKEDFLEEDFFDESPFLPQMPKKSFQRPQQQQETPTLPNKQQFLDALKGMSQKQHQPEQQNQQQNWNQQSQQQTGAGQQQRQQPQQKKQAPPDWLVPKVYKGSSNI